METAVVIIVVALAVALAGYRLFRDATGKSCGCGAARCAPKRPGRARARSCLAPRKPESESAPENEG